ncbi:MAG: hypothetical protein Q8Q91_03515, partial [Candidatus Daviesbacteria bacterium]|nr:hypothetical protein [Candidatus Daviesbacteria bacterium]
MDKAILKTLVYADIFDYPLTLREIHKWLINKKATLQQIEKKLPQKNYYCLPGREKIIKIRKQREKQSKIYLRKAKIIALFLNIIPWIKLVGISGGLAMNNVLRKDDIDLFLITAKNRLWISRLLALGLLSLIGQRRKAGDLGQKAAGKICINTLLEEDCLEQANKDIYLAHEVLQMKVLWQRDGIYAKYLEDNFWAFKFLPNWIAALSSPRMRGSKKKIANWIPAFAGMTMEKIAKWFQLKIMKAPKGQERI